MLRWSCDNETRLFREMATNVHTKRQREKHVTRQAVRTCKRACGSACGKACSFAVKYALAAVCALKRGAYVACRCAANLVWHRTVIHLANCVLAPVVDYIVLAVFLLFVCAAVWIVCVCVLMLVRTPDVLLALLAMALLVAQAWTMV